MENIREAMQVIRGKKLFRGREEYFLPQGLVVLPCEQRGASKADGAVYIYFSDNENELHAELKPGGEKFTIADFRMDLMAFLEHAAHLSRGSSYVTTNSKSADYRKKPDTESQSAD